MKRRRSTVFISLILMGILLVNLTGCKSAEGQVQAADLMKGFEGKTISGKKAEDAFIQSQMELGTALFQAAVSETKEENVLISPLSIELGLAMTANGADGQTKEEMESLLGNGIRMEDLNEYLYTYVNSLSSGEKYKLEMANSIWFRDDENRLTVKEGFLQTNADYYDAQIYKSPFDEQTRKDINNWCQEYTDGMIQKILEEIDPDTVMYLINALVFDAEWKEVYEKSDLNKGTFRAISGQERKVTFMNSEESRYLQDDQAVGFIKDYKDGKYSFAVLLPKEDVSVREYIQGLTGKELWNTLNSAKSERVMAAMPKFSYEYGLSMNDVLKELGMPSAFNSKMADFSKMAKSSRGNIFIGDVLHKTYICVDELGTKAGAVTKVEMKDESAPMYDKEVILNHPFVFMILDSSVNLPIFMGTVMDIPE